ncbi:MAG: serine/threonine-protein kinase [Planctomycetaceae bacterium]
MIPRIGKYSAEGEQGRQVLLKCLPKEWLTDRGKVAQFRQEVLLSCSLSHPCLAKVIEAGTFQETEFLALEFLEGLSVSQHLAKTGRFSEQRCLQILRPIAEVLHLIHEAGVIYRDLRPQNIVLVDDDQPILAEIRFSEELSPDDNVTMSGRGAVTSQYIAPERLLGKPSSVASDVYTLGATLYAMITGREPFADEPDTLQLLIAKNNARYPLPKTYAPELSDACGRLIADCLKANPAHRPASAEEFATRLAECYTAQTAEESPAGSDDPHNLLHAVWDQLDAELQDAFSLAYNKKRRTGANRISTRDLFEAMDRLGTGPLREVFNRLPAGALPEPIAGDVPIDRTVLTEVPLLSDCVQDSLRQFRKLALVAEKISPVDLFVDVAKHGHGASVVRLREHGIDPAAMERIVHQLGLRVVRRESIEHGSEQSPFQSALSPLRDDNVQFTVYRPKVIPPETWQPLLAFAHLSERRPDAPAGAPDPLAEVQRQASQILSQQTSAYQPLTTDSGVAIGRSDELTFVPTGEGLVFNPPSRSFLWQEPVHREEFRFQAAGSLDGKSARGRMSVFLGRLLIAEVNFTVRVERSAAAVSDESNWTGEDRARRFRRIFACVSRQDRSYVVEFERYAQLLNDTVWSTPIGPERALVDVPKLIQSADIFQLFWSTNALRSREMAEEWTMALSLNRTGFIRSLYWEEPLPSDPDRSLPPPELLALGFQKIPKAVYGESVGGGSQRILYQSSQVSPAREAAFPLSNAGAASDAGESAMRGEVPTHGKPGKIPDSRTRIRPARSASSATSTEDEFSDLRSFSASLPNAASAAEGPPTRSGRQLRKIALIIGGTLLLLGAIWWFVIR